MQGFNFDPNTKYDSPNSLIPANTLAFATLKVRELRQGQETGGTYADVELTIAEGQYATRKVWPVIMDPTDAKNSEGARTMGMGAIQHICEAIGLFDPANPQTYSRFDNGSFIDVLKAIDGKRVAIKIGIEKGKNGHQDKNRVLAWLTPNPNSGDNKGWKDLHAGNSITAPAATMQTGAGSFGGFSGGNAAAPAAAQAGGFSGFNNNAAAGLKDDDIPFDAGATAPNAAAPDWLS